jgi:hypothetical protein
LAKVGTGIGKGLEAEEAAVPPSTGSDGKEVSTEPIERLGAAFPKKRNIKKPPSVENGRRKT